MPKIVILTTFVIVHKKKDLVCFHIYVGCIYLQQGNLALNMFILEFYLHAWDTCSIVL